VAVDAVCRPSRGKLLLDALEACRLPNGWRTRSVGMPRSTVYFSARVRDDVKARAYCRNLKTKEGEPFARIRLEAQARYEPLDSMLEEVIEPSFGAAVWESRFGGLEGSVTRLAREVQTDQIAGRVGKGEMTYAQGERMGMFLDLERLGLARAYYKSSVMRVALARLGGSGSRLTTQDQRDSPQTWATWFEGIARPFGARSRAKRLRLRPRAAAAPQRRPGRPRPDRWLESRNDPVRTCLTHRTTICRPKRNAQPSCAASRRSPDVCGSDG
jgi:hypothetical protein